MRLVPASSYTKDQVLAHSSKGWLVTTRSAFSALASKEA